MAIRGVMKGAFLACPAATGQSGAVSRPFHFSRWAAFATAKNRDGHLHFCKPAPPRAAKAESYRISQKP
jgi:hypothetical protein